MEENLFQERTNLEELKKSVSLLNEEISKVIVGQEKMIELLLAGVLADGHILIEGVPGVAKTLTAKLLSRSISVGFSRIQFTPDLMPSDVIGTSIFNPREMIFQFRPGPVFSNILLIDEINRAP
ncbi:MAG: magnesium chelatase, partial [Bacteroidetes bacterium]